MNLELILFVIYILNNVFASQQKWLVATTDKCIFTVSKNFTIKFEKYPALFVNSIKAVSFEDCRSACCSHSTCNGYVFDGSDLSDGCKLLKCSKNGNDCKKDLEKYDKDIPGEVGFITGLTVTSETVVNETKPDPTSANINGSPDSIESAAPEPAQEKIEQKEKASSEESHPNSGSSTHIEDPLDSLMYALPTATVEKLVFDPTIKMTSASGDNIETIYNVTGFIIDPNEDGIKEHTNTISLCIAFVFGIVFLVTVFYLTGKRWVESIKDRQRRGYTRINYLLNGV